MSLTIDRTFGGRRINRRIKTDDPQVLDGCVAMLHAFYANKRAWFDAIYYKRVSLLDAWALFSVGRLPDLPESPDEAVSLKSRWKAWVESGRDPKTNAPYSAKHKASLMLSWGYLAKHGAKDYRSLATAVASFKKASVLDHPTTVMLARSAALAFLRNNAEGGVTSSFYLAVKAVEPVKVTRDIDDQLALPVETLRERLDKVAEPYRTMAWELVCTGMGWKEYTEDGFTVLRHGVEIHGEKRTARHRVVPYVRPILGAKRKYRAFHATLKKAELTPYQLRRCFIQYLARIGLEAFWQDYYAGHEPERVTGTYQQPKAPTEAELIAHGKLLKAYIGEDASVLSITRSA